MLAVKTLVPQPVIFRRNVRLMGDMFEISVVGDNRDWADDRIDEAIVEISRVEKLLSTFGDDSPVNEINRYAGAKPVKTNPEIFRLIERALQISDLTQGAFDLTYYSTDQENNRVSDTPEKNSKATKQGNLNYQNIILDQRATTVFLKEKGMRIGFGANCRGYAADRAKYILQMNGVGSGVINAGGDLLAWGLQLDNEPWTVGTADPSQKGMPLAGIEISNMALATSANADKHTASLQKKPSMVTQAIKGFAVSSIRSVSVLSPTAELSDSMASPLMTIGINNGLYIVNQLNQMACVMVDDNDRLYTSKGVNI
jgi:thiamine biosynthesis lipoprotein